MKAYIPVFEKNVFFNAMQCNAMQCNAMQYNTIQYNTIHIQWNIIPIEDFVSYFLSVPNLLYLTKLKYKNVTSLVIPNHDQITMMQLSHSEDKLTVIINVVYHSMQK